VKGEFDFDVVTAGAFDGLSSADIRGYVKEK
jgi:hypothetical protein